MKTISSLLLLIVSVFAFAQTQISVDALPRAMSKGTHPSYMILIPQGTLKGVEKDWQKYISAGTKEKVIVVKGETYQAGAVNANVSAVPFNIYSTLLETSEGVRLTAWITEDDSVFISREVSTDKDLAIQKYLRDFGVREYRHVVEGELRRETDTYNKLEKELDALVNEEEKAAKRISENNRSIQEAQDGIATNNADIQTKAYHINDSKNMVYQTQSDENANKGAKKSLKALENEQKSLRKSKNDKGKKIDQLKKEIRAQERAMSNLQLQREAKSAEIAKQKLKLQEIKTKLENIV
jgi:hypothetical protein